MKGLILLFGMLFIMSFVVAQDTCYENQVILEYIDNNFGSRIGTGICEDLVTGAMKSVDKKYIKNRTTKSVYGTEIDSSNLEVGDIVVYSGVLFADGTKAYSHIGIVYSINGNGVYSIAEQNCEGLSLKESKVCINDYDFKTIKKGKIKFYHPF